VQIAAFGTASQTEGVIVDIKLIKRLIQIVEESQISGLKLEEGGLRIEIEKNSASTVVMSHPSYAPAPNIPSPPTPSPLPSEPISVAKNESGITIKSPMVGTFYGSPNPDSPAYVKVGDTVKIGQVVCIVEAMKLFNEIESEVSGVIEKCLVENGQPIEYGQDLFFLRK